MNLKPKAMRESTILNKEIFLTELSRNAGYVKPTTEVTGLSRTQFYQWMKEDDCFKEKVNQIFYSVKSFTRSKIYLKILLEANANAVQRLNKAVDSKMEKFNSKNK